MNIAGFQLPWQLSDTAGFKFYWFTFLAVFILSWIIPSKWLA